MLSAYSKAFEQVKKGPGFVFSTKQSKEISTIPHRRLGLQNCLGLFTVELELQHTILEGDLAQELLKEMVSRGITPDDSTYYSLIEGIENVDEFLRKGDS